MKRATILLKKPCKSINLLIKHAILCLITDFSHLKNLNWLMFTITMIPSFRMIFPRNTHILKQNG
jgi:hypothetical protein